MARGPRLALLSLVLLLLGGCSSTPEPAPPSPELAATPFQRTFGPLFPGLPPLPPGARIDGAVLSRDRMSLDLSFIGGQAYDRTNPCSEDYAAWAGGAGDTLDVEILAVDHPDQLPLAPNMACTAEGHSYLFRIVLPAPFLGTTVRDRPSGPIWIAPPDLVAEPGLLPDGWRLTSISAEPSIAELGRTYQPGPDVPGVESRFMALYQAFGGPTSNQVDQPVARGSVHGQDVAIGRNGDEGFAVGWAAGRDHLWFSVVDPAVTLDGFVAMANAVAVPGP